MPKLTKSYIDTLKPTGKSYEVWDTDIKGLGCMVHPSGRKTYYFLYRHNGSKKQRLKVGIHGNITCEIAREIARGWTGDLARGIDPKDQNKKRESEEKQSILMKEFLTIYAEKHKKAHNKHSTIHRDSYRLKNTILPFFGHMIVSEVASEDILRFQDHLKYSTIQFNRCCSLLSAAFKIAELWGHRPKNSNPCQGIKRYPEKRKQRFLTQEELEKLDFILKEEETLGSLSRYSLAAIRMLIYTGCRLEEVLSLKWRDVFLKEGYFHLKDSKGGETAIPLSESAKTIFKNVEKDKENPYVFIGGKPGTCLTTLKRAWSKVRERANLKEVRIHDLRHTFASLAIKQGIDLYTVSKLLGHKNIATTTRYAHLEMKQLIKATNKIDEIWQEKARDA